MAIGTKTKATAVNATAVGAYAQALGDYAFAGGADSYAFGERGIAIGVHTNEAELAKLVTSQNNTNTINETAFKTFVKYEQTIRDLVSNESTRNDLLSDISKLDALVANTTALNAAVNDQKKRDALVNYQKQIAETKQLLIQDGRYARLKALNPYGAIGGQSISIGNQNLASGAYAVSVGTDAKATNYGTSAYGYQADASGTQSTALGFASKGSGEFSTAVGTAAESKGETSVALGYAAKANGRQGIAIGHGASVIAGGGTNNDELGWGSIAIGRSAQSKAGLSIAIGADAENFDRGQGTHTAAVAIGTGAKTYGTGSVAIGNNSHANDGGGIYGTAVGTTSKAIGDYSVALGLHGDQTNQNRKFGAYGYASNAVGLYALAEGIYSNALGATSKAMGHYSVAIGTQVDQVGNREFGAYGYGSNAIGLYSYARGLYSNALGSESQAYYNDSVALGHGTLAYAVNSTAIGSGAQTVGMNSAALGYKATATIDSGVALGSRSDTSGFRYTAGYDILKNKNQDISEIIGAANVGKYNEQKKIIEAADKKIEAANEILKEAEYKRIHGATAADKADGETLTQANRKIRDDAIVEKEAAIEYMKKNFGKASTWESTEAGVSVGNSDLGITRQINNLAAGTLDTDAVNVAQLKLLASAPVTIYNGGNVANSQYNLGTQIDKGNVHINNLRFAFTDGLKAELQKDKDQNNVVVVSLSGGGNNGDNGNNGTAGKDGKDGKDGRDGRDGKDGKDGTILTPDSVVTVKEVQTGKTVMNDSGVTIKNNDINKQVSITENGLNNGGNTITNIAPGINPTDAVNKNQLDQAELRIQRRIDRINKRADAGTASAIAQASIPQVTAPGKTGIGVGSGYYGNQSAVSLGASRMSDNGKWIFKGSFSSNTQGKVGVGAGAMYQW